MNGPYVEEDETNPLSFMHRPNLKRRREYNKAILSGPYYVQLLFMESSMITVRSNVVLWVINALKNKKNNYSH
jgi:hypothetical protein